MIRFFFNFIVFGLIFFVIHKFAPEAFQTLVRAVSTIYDFLADLFIWIYQSVKNLKVAS